MPLLPAACAHPGITAPHTLGHPRICPELPHKPALPTSATASSAQQKRPIHSSLSSRQAAFGAQAAASNNTAGMLRCMLRCRVSPLGSSATASSMGSKATRCALWAPAKRHSLQAGEMEAAPWGLTLSSVSSAAPRAKAQLFYTRPSKGCPR